MPDGYVGLFHSPPGENSLSGGQERTHHSLPFGSTQNFLFLINQKNMISRPARWAQHKSFKGHPQENLNLGSMTAFPRAYTAIGNTSIADSNHGEVPVSKVSKHTHVVGLSALPKM